MPFGTLALKCDCCTPCDCRVCLTVQGCGTGITADFGVYTSAGCTGSPIATGSYDGSTPTCVCVPASGLYYVQVTPTGAASGVYRPHCFLLDVTDDDCAGEKDVTFNLWPYKYGVTVKVGGRPVFSAGGCKDEYGEISDIYSCYCGVEGATVRWQDGVNDLSATTDADGYVAFSDIDTPDAGAGYTITVSDLDCGYDLPATFTGTLGVGDFCPSTQKLVTLDPASGFEYMEACTHPLPTTLYLDIYGGTTTLSYAGYSYVFSRETWEGCTGITCSSRIMPVTCTFDEPQPPEDYYRYQISSGTVYLKFRLYVAGIPDEFGQPCTSDVTYRLEVYGVTASPLCTPDGVERLAAKTWRFLGGSPSNPANWVQDTWDCSNVPSAGGVTVALDSGTWTDFCTCGGFSIDGSVGSADGIPCAADDYTLRY